MAKKKNTIKRSPVLSFGTMAKWGAFFSDQLETSEKLLTYMGVRLHFQASNIKTGSLGEGSVAVLTCAKKVWLDWTSEGVERGINCGALPPCARCCYAWRQMIQYPAYGAAMVRNTLLRRADPVQYYADFFAHAAATTARRLRLNESGDFETLEQVRACFDAARNNPGVTAWGYTQRPAEWIADAPANVTIRVSCWTDLDKGRDLIARGFKVACVTTNGLTTCPAQMGKKAGGKAWTCADCARRGCGCCGPAKSVFFKQH